MKPIFFKNPAEFRKWLEKNHAKETALQVGFYKKATGKPTMTWPESVDEALSFGWIDGVVNAIDEESYTRRFTPRKPGSIWSNVNIKKAEKLIKDELMSPAGLAAYQLRKAEKSGIYSFEKEAVALDKDAEKQFKANTKAWDFFEKQAPSYKKRIVHWLMDAKQEKTKLSRLEKIISLSENGERH